MKKLVLLYQGYPQITKTYMENELQELRINYEILILNVYRPANVSATTYENYLDCYEKDYNYILTKVKEFGPEHIHGHYFHVLPLLVKLAEEIGITCSLRAHSADILDPEKMGTDKFPIQRSIEASYSKFFKGILTFPFTIQILKNWGIQSSKIISVPPVFNFDLFDDRTDNGEDIINIGAALPKKNMKDYIKLASLMPSLNFNLYGIGFNVQELKELNQSYNNPVNINSTIPYHEMPKIYKNHSWLVYTACKISNSVGWPMAVLEAQASGVGVCIQNIRPDLKEFVNDSAILFNEINELPKIISNKPSLELIEKGFLNSQKYNYKNYSNILNQLIENN